MASGCGQQFPEDIGLDGGVVIEEAQEVGPRVQRPAGARVAAGGVPEVFIEPKDGDVREFRLEAGTRVIGRTVIDEDRNEARISGGDDGPQAGEAAAGAVPVDHDHGEAGLDGVDHHASLNTTPSTRAPSRSS